jgi:hypothetical protein
VLLGCLGLLVAFTKLFQKTPIGQTLHRYLVEIPVEKTGNIGAGALIFLIVSLTLIPSLALIFSVDIAVIAGLDFALYYEVVITTWTISSVVKVKAICTNVKTRLLGVFGRKPTTQARTQRAKRTRKQAQPSNDNDDHHAHRAVAA